MSKLLVTSDSHWYDQLSSVAYYGETEFQKAIQQHIADIFKDYFAFPFSKTIKSALGSSKPDLGLISKNLKEWWVIEVELGKHSLENHVLVQIDNFRLGKYPESILSQYFHQKINELYKIVITEEKIKKLLRKERPKILVVVDEEKKDWIKELGKRDVKLCLFQIFKNGIGQHVYRLNGSYPYIVIEQSHCKPDNFWGSNLLEIKNKHFIAGNRVNFSISFAGLQTKWYKFSDKGKTYLRFIGRVNPLPPNSTFLLIKDSSKKLSLIKN